MFRSNKIPINLVLLVFWALAVGLLGQNKEKKYSKHDPCSAEMSAELSADPDNRQKAFQVGVSQNHVDFQDRQLERSTRLIKMHEQRGTADKN